MEAVVGRGVGRARRIVPWKEVDMLWKGMFPAE